MSRFISARIDKKTLVELLSTYRFEHQAGLAIRLGHSTLVGLPAGRGYSVNLGVWPQNGFCRRNALRHACRTTLQ